ncbi:hypothetical protein MYX82_03990 [Acidobacteria bacterium AH-259-D05]|nr:hypothetical protein [Acidobacteria bacterium AH-259-D05]
MTGIKSKLIWRGVGGLLLLVVALVAIFYGKVARDIQTAYGAFLSREDQVAQQRYTDILSTFQKLPFLKTLFRNQYQLALFNYVQLLYSDGNYSEVVNTLEQEANQFPSVAGKAPYHLWMGNAFFRIAILQEGEDLTFESLQTIAEEYKEAIRVDRGNWDAKHNYDFVKDLLVKKTSDDPQEKETLKLLLGDIRLTSMQRRGELPEKLH